MRWRPRTAGKSMLMAMVITLDNSFINSFMPSQSSLWPDIVERIEVLRKYEATI
jgi:hypothetical protein